MTRVPIGARAGALLAVALAACGGPSSRDYREDRQALTQVLAADAHTAELMDPVVDQLGTGRDTAATLQRLEGLVAGAAERALRLARRARVRTPEGRALKDDLVQAAEERQGLAEAFATAVRSGRPEDALDAVRGARELEERLGEIDARVEALAK